MLSGTLAAEDFSFVNGATPLAKGRKAFSFDLGVEYPEPILYGIRFDYGFVKNYQVGASAFYYPKSFYSIGMNNAIALIESGSHHFGFIFSPSYVVDLNSKTILLSPVLVYEHRIGNKQRTGLFLKGGTAHARVSRDIFASSYGLYFKRVSPDEDFWENSFIFKAGIQHQVGKKLAITFEVGTVTKMDFSDVLSDAFFSDPIGKIALTWGF